MPLQPVTNGVAPERGLISMDELAALVGMSPLQSPTSRRSSASSSLELSPEWIAQALSEVEAIVATQTPTRAVAAKKRKSPKKKSPSQARKTHKEAGTNLRKGYRSSSE